MRRRQVSVVAGVLMAIASASRAQTSTADGVAAFVRGDYQRAVDILKPKTEQPAQPDHVADFFLAALYDAGRGVPMDAVRACALYVRASADGSTPFGVHAMALVRVRQESLGKDQFEDCMLLANVGHNHRFQPVTFMLDQGHWIAWDLKGATITYDGKEKRIETSVALNGVVFLPLQHTELMTGETRSIRRHFIEAFTWWPDKDPNTWRLLWHLFEVVRDELIQSATEEVTTISAPDPLGVPFDVSEYVRLRVNDTGHAEWALLKGAPPQTGVIASDAERQEDTRRTLARNAAETSVDWTRVRDAHRTPAFAYSDADGCRDLFVFGWNDDRTEVITVRADKNLLQLSTIPQTFDVAAQSSALELVLHVYERPVRRWPFCTDVGGPAARQETWRAIRGMLTVELSPPGVSPRGPSVQRATIHIAGAEFINGAGIVVRQMEPIVLTALID